MVEMIISYSIIYYILTINLMNFEEKSTAFPSITLNERQLCDFEMITNGGYFPLKGFMNKSQYEMCLESMEIKKGVLFSIPITLSINNKMKENLKHFDHVTLKHVTGLPLAIMKIDSIYDYDVENESKKCIGCYSLNHPFTKVLQQEYDDGFKYYIGGDIIDFKTNPHYDFLKFRKNTEETKEYFKKKGWKTIVGFQTRNPMHQSHYQLTKYALQQAGNGKNAKLFLSPCVGVTQACDVDYRIRAKCYTALLDYYEKDQVLLNLLNFPMRMYGPRSALFHAIIRKNFGCTHFVVGRDHAGPSSKKKCGADFFEPYEAQDLFLQYAKQINITPILSTMIVYGENKISNEGKYLKIDDPNIEKYNVFKLSGTKQRELLNAGETLPDWFTFKEVKEILQTYYVNKKEQGLCLYLYGLSGSGKSYISNFLKSKLNELTDRTISLIDGDIIRNHISKGLGFSKQDRSINVRRIGYVASEITKHKGICIVSNIAPYIIDRQFNKDLISNFGNYIEILVDTPIKICEKRDCKGLYKLARQNKIENFTGINDTFEKYSHEDLIVNGDNDVDIILDEILSFLKEKELI